MIQRIQSLYLLGAGLIETYFLINFLSLGIFLPFDTFDTFDTCIHAIIIILSFYIIFKFNNRKAQVKLTRILLIISVVKTILTLISPWLIIASFEGKEGMPDSINLVPYLLSTILPVLQVIFIYLAFRAIKKDEALVRSVDRLR